ncbi:MAG: hypothetical protein KKA79_08880 [Nanoarchaeota archaeon]|nr:hypothetical protein [Nanoarchaeota archaeon]MCG2717926.1 hypothetical protein [Nanoarchaeota archaeon]
MEKNKISKHELEGRISELRKQLATLEWDLRNLKNEDMRGLKGRKIDQIKDELDSLIAIRNNLFSTEDIVPDSRRRKSKEANKMEEELLWGFEEEEEMYEEDLGYNLSDDEDDFEEEEESEEDYDEDMDEDSEE